MIIEIKVEKLKYVSEKKLAMPKHQGNSVRQFIIESSVTRWMRAHFPTKILKFPQFFPTILRIPNLIVKFPKPNKVGIIILNYLEIVAYGA